ncbi:MAG: DMT family transporter [Lachnospiraceae bacterium]|nr:DMT family transporter [Lachnospiraceae bacterium]
MIQKIKTSRILWSFMFVLIAMIWGVAFVVVKDSVLFIAPVYMVAFRFTIAFIAGCIFCFFRGARLNKEVLKSGIYLGISLFVAYILQTIGIEYTTAGKNAFITTVYIILVPFMNFALYRASLSPAHIIGAVMSFTGVGFLTLGGIDGINIGDVLTFLCAISFSVQIILTARYSPHHDAMLLNTIQLGVCAVAGWILAPIIDGPVSQGISFSPSMILSMLYLGLLSTFFAECVQTYGLRYVDPLLGTILMSLESVFGVLSSVILLGEKITGKMLLGIVLMFTAIIIVEIQEGKRDNAKNAVS